MTKRPSAAPSDRARVRRTPEKAAYDRATVNAILDACPTAHVGYVLNGAPIVTPTLQWRIGDHVYWHGSAASRMLRMVKGAQVCLTVTITDGLLTSHTLACHAPRPSAETSATISSPWERRQVVAIGEALYQRQPALQ